jgi:DNA-binding NtrC family response regulator
MSPQLQGHERDFFSRVAHAGFNNQFSEQRKAIEAEIAGVPPGTKRKLRTEKFLAAIRNSISDLESRQMGTIEAFYGEDRALMKKVFLLELFYRFKEHFDQLISAQIEIDPPPLRIPFYNEVFSAMVARGFSEADFRHYLPLGFQIRRAFYFIDRNLIGNSACMKTLRLKLWNNVFTHDIDIYDKYLRYRMEDFSTLILGETGTGKGSAAMAIGRSGYIPLDKRWRAFAESFTRSFVSLNLSQFPETLIESALFGHKKGSFTGAIEDNPGAFEQCSPYGAILLDEIGEISRPVQVKLLQVLQERVFSPVGSRKISRFKGRVIAATNRPLEQIRGGGLFREDFYYRLCSDIITVPTLRQRISEDPNELSLLLHLTLKRLIGEPSSDLAVMVEEVIKNQLGEDYQWPGNVRELEQCVRGVLLRGTYTGEISAGGMDINRELINGIEQGSIDAASLISGYCRLLYQRYNTFEEVARRTGLDRRTVKKYIQIWDTSEPENGGIKQDYE